MRNQPLIKFTLVLLLNFLLVTGVFANVVTGHTAGILTHLGTSEYDFDSGFDSDSLVIREVTVDSIFTDRVVISWITDNPAGTGIINIFPENTSKTLILNQSLKNKHTFTLKGQPSQLFTIIPFSFIENDTVYAEAMTVITASKSTGEVKVYFNKPVNNQLSTGTDAICLTNAIDDTLVRYINRAKYSIDLAIYNISEPSGLADIPAALNAARTRGVTVRIVYDGTTSATGIPYLNTGIGKIARPENIDGIMHNKFLVIDAKSDNPNDALVWTGSTNMTKAQLLTDANSVIIIQDKSLALAYTLEFEEMFGSTGSQPNPTMAKFGPGKTDNTPHDFMIGGKKVKLYFSPSDGVNGQIINTINTADHDLFIATMLITRTELANPIKSRYYQGVDTRVLVNTDGQCTDDVLAILKLLGFDFCEDGENGIMHHKYMIVDANHAGSDPMVLLGCHNWSYSAETKNDENTLIIHDPVLANIYYQEFDVRFSAGKPLDMRELILEEKALKVYPNPTSGQFSIKNLNPLQSGDVIEIFTLDGSLVFSSVCSALLENTIDLPDLAPGIYALRLHTTGKIFNTRIIKK